MALQPFQYQIGDVVFGKGTDIIVKKVDLQPYNINNQDFQLPRADEVRFGVDTLAPGAIIFELSVLNNFAMENMEALTGENTSLEDSLLGQSRSLLGNLANEWKASNIRRSWNAMKPLYFCDENGVVRRIYGRPARFTHAASMRGQHWIDVQCEFRRADTYAYSDIEQSQEILRGDNPNWIMQSGDAPAWFRLVFYGPVEHPIVQIGDAQIELDITIDASTVLEVSSYPWGRRIVDSNGINYRTKLIGSTQYLDELRFPAGEEIPVRWTDDANGGITWTELPSSRWVENVDFLDLFTLWIEYEMISGQIFWAGNLLSGGYVSAPLGTGAALDQIHSFTTPDQFARVRIASGAPGKSALVVMSNDAMTNYAAVLVENNLNIIGGTDYLHLCTGNSPTNMTIQDTYTIPGRINAHDTVGIWTDNTSKELNVQHNGADVLNWNDSGLLLDWANNKRQGFIINYDNIPLIPGCGFDNLVCHDISVSLPPEEGKCFVMWRDGWNVV